MNVVLLSLFLIFESIEQAAMVNFILFKTFSKSQKPHVEYFEREIEHLLPCGLFLPQYRIKLLQQHNANSHD